MNTSKEYIRRTIINALTPFSMTFGVWCLCKFVNFSLSDLLNVSVSNKEILEITGFFGVAFFTVFFILHHVDNNTEFNRNIVRTKKAYIKEETRKTFNKSANYRIYVESKIDNPDVFFKEMTELQTHILNIERLMASNSDIDAEINHYKGIKVPIEYFTILLMYPETFDTYNDWIKLKISRLSELTYNYAQALSSDSKSTLNDRKIRVTEKEIDEILEYTAKQLPMAWGIINNELDFDPIEFREEVAHAVYEAE